MNNTSSSDWLAGIFIFKQGLGIVPKSLEKRRSYLKLQNSRETSSSRRLRGSSRDPRRPFSCLTMSLCEEACVADLGGCAHSSGTMKSFPLGQGLGVSLRVGTHYCAHVWDSGAFHQFVNCPQGSWILILIRSVLSQGQNWSCRRVAACCLGTESPSVKEDEGSVALGAAEGRCAGGWWQVRQKESRTHTHTHT